MAKVLKIGEIVCLVVIAFGILLRLVSVGVGWSFGANLAVPVVAIPIMIVVLGIIADSVWVIFFGKRRR